MPEWAQVVIFIMALFAGPGIMVAIVTIGFAVADRIERERD